MKIALYYPWVYLKSGVEKTILETVKRSRHQYTIFTHHYDKKSTYPEFKKHKVVELRKIPVDRTMPSVIKAATIIGFQKINLEEFDLLLVHSEGLGDLILTRNNKIPSACFCHTPLRAVFDREYKIRALRARGFVDKRIYAFLSFAFTQVDRYLWSKYTHIFFNSRETLHRAQEGGLLHSLRGRYEVLHPGVNVQKVSPIYKPYFLLPGRIMWTKNIELAINAFNHFSSKLRPEGDFKLIITGQVDQKSKAYFERLKALSEPNKNIQFIPDPSDDKLRNLYAQCFAVLATSFNEDWGLVAIEANCYAKPALCLNKGGFKESQINGKTGFLLTNSPKDFAHAMLRLCNDISLVRRLGKTARAHAEKYSWRKFIEAFDKRIIALKPRQSISMQD